jgi:hypothetical protein
MKRRRIGSRFWALRYFAFSNRASVCEAYSGDGFDECQADWTDYVLRNNQAAATFVAENIRSQGYGYILTTSSQDEAKL